MTDKWSILVFYSVSLFTALTHLLRLGSTSRNVLSQADFQQVHSDIETEQMLAVKSFRPTSTDLLVRLNYVTYLLYMFFIFLPFQ